MPRLATLLLATAVVLIAGTFAASQFLPDRNPFPPIGQCLPRKAEAGLNDPPPYQPLGLGPVAVGLALSGGGSRAAYLAAAVLREIRASELTVPQPASAPPVNSLLEQIDLISSVSGGSFAGTYFTQNHDRLAKGDAQAPEWRDFLDRMAFSYRDDLLRSALLRPSAWPKFLFSDFNRGSLARERYAELLYGSASLADLPARPALFVNAFDIANHVRYILSKHAVDTAYSLPRNYWGLLHEPRELTNANDMTFARLDPASIRLADAVYASSAFPIAYPNLPLAYCGTRVFFPGGQTFLSDGAMADNTGLLTLAGQMRAVIKDGRKRAAVLMIFVDASLDRLDSGSSFQGRGIEARYAWKDTIVGHANEAINASIALLQDVSWKWLGESGIVTDQLSGNWGSELSGRTGRCGSQAKMSWSEPFESGKLVLKPLIIRLGLRDVLNPDFMMRFAPADAQRPEALKALLAANALPDGLAAMSTTLHKRIAGIATDFTLSPEARATLDLAAYVLVHSKLATDLDRWSDVLDKAIKAQPAEVSCQK